jgi:hypothetical protein
MQPSTARAKLLVVFVAKKFLPMPLGGSVQLEESGLQSAETSAAMIVAGRYFAGAITMTI